MLQQDSTRIIGGEIVSHIQQSDSAGASRIVMRERVEELRSLVRNSRLIERPDVIFTPHAAFNSKEAVARIDEQTVRSIRQFLAGHPVNRVPRDAPAA